MPTRHRPARLAVCSLALAGLLGAAACGADDRPDTEGPSGAASQGVTAGSEVTPETWPLTGLPAKGGSAAARHPVMVL